MSVAVADKTLAGTDNASTPGETYSALRRTYWMDDENFDGALPECRGILFVSSRTP
jgi:hypothetical protein